MSSVTSLPTPTPVDLDVSPFEDKVSPLEDDKVPSTEDEQSQGGRP